MKQKHNNKYIYMQRSSALHNPDFREGKTTRKKEPQNTADFIKIICTIND